jgi:hypothetical protein
VNNARAAPSPSCSSLRTYCHRWRSNRTRGLPPPNTAWNVKPGVIVFWYSHARLWWTQTRRSLSHRPRCRLYRRPCGPRRAGRRPGTRCLFRHRLPGWRAWVCVGPPLSTRRRSSMGSLQPDSADGPGLRAQQTCGVCSHPSHWGAAYSHCLRSRATPRPGRARSTKENGPT